MKKQTIEVNDDQSIEISKDGENIIFNITNCWPNLSFAELTNAQAKEVMLTLKLFIEPSSDVN